MLKSCGTLPSPLLQGPIFLGFLSLHFVSACYVCVCVCVCFPSDFSVRVFFGAEEKYLNFPFKLCFIVKFEEDKNYLFLYVLKEFLFLICLDLYKGP